MADLAEMDEEPAQLGVAEVLENAVRTLKVWGSYFQYELNEPTLAQSSQTTRRFGYYSLRLEVGPRQDGLRPPRM